MITEPLTWHILADNPADLPDADLTVMIELDPASDYSEPVFMGSWDGEAWRDVHGVEVPVIAWADVPRGTASVLAPPACVCDNGHRPTNSECPVNANGPTFGAPASLPCCPPGEPHAFDCPNGVPPSVARVGDCIECDVREPAPRTIRLKLETEAATLYANELLQNPASGWRKAVAGVLALDERKERIEQEIRQVARQSKGTLPGGSGVPASKAIPCGRPAKGLCQRGAECWCGWDNVAQACVAAECRCATPGVTEPQPSRKEP
jgi:hypothetical protein